MAAARTLLKELEDRKADFNGEAAARKRELVRALGRKRLATADQVLRLHECLGFLRAYPDDAALLEEVEEALAAFERRGDLRAHRDELVNSGVAGTEIHFRFYWFMARWLAGKWPGSLSIDWEEFEQARTLADRMLLVMPFTEFLALEEISLAPRELIERLKGADETDADFVLRRYDQLEADTFGHERLYEEMDIPMVFQPAPGSPSRTRARHAGLPVVFQEGPLDARRPELRKVAGRPPRAVRRVSRREGRRLIHLAREAMVSRDRDLDVFIHADPDDVQLVDCGGGLQFAAMGMVPERRLLLDSVYGFLTLKNGVPLGYVLTSSLFGTTELAYNIFDTFRGGEAGHVFGQAVAMVHHLFGSDVITIEPYQMGYGNPEGLQSGAWWFYYKLGFRPVDPGIQRLASKELARVKKQPRHRTSTATLERLAADNMFFYFEQTRDDVLGFISFGNLGLRVSAWMAARYGAERERGIRECAQEAAKLLGVRAFRGWSRGEKQAWERWGPLVCLLPGLARWPAADRKALVKVIRAKGARCEADFVRLFDAHRRLRRAVLKLAEEPL